MVKEVKVKVNSFSKRTRSIIQMKIVLVNDVMVMAKMPLIVMACCSRRGLEIFTAG